jgi:signal transduction histidine kinase
MLMKQLFIDNCLLALLVLIAINPLQQGIAQQPGDRTSPGQTLSQPADPQQQLELLLSAATNENDAKKAVMLAENAVNLADSIRNQPLKAKALHTSGIAWKIWGNNLKSTERLNQALDIYAALKMEKEIARVQRDLGETFRAARGFNFSLVALGKALKYFEAINDSVEMAKTYNRIAATRFEKVFSHHYFRVLDPDLSKYRYILENALDKFPEIKAEVDSLHFYINLTYAISNKLNLTDLIISTDIIKVGIDALDGDFEKTLANFDRIIDKMYQYDDLHDLPLVLINKSRILGWNIMGQPENAIPLALQAMDMAKKSNIRMYEYLASEILHENYREKGDFEKAYIYARNLQALMQQFHNEDLTLKLKTQEFDFQIKEREMELKYRRIQLMILIIAGIVLVGLFTYFSLILVRKNRRLHKLLLEINKKNHIITKQNEDLAHANAEKDKFFSIIAHDLRTPFNAFLGFSELMADESFDVSLEEMKSYAKDIRKSAYLLFELLENLLEWSRLQRNMIKMEQLEYPLLRLAHQSVDTLHENAEKKQITIKILFDHTITVLADEKMIQSVFRNLISNAIKFTNRGGNITISARNIENGMIEIKVQDTGIGISEQELPKLFRIDESLKSTGTDGEPSIGLGLILCKEFVEKHGGKIWAESEAGIGSAFYFTLKAV